MELQSTVQDTEEHKSEAVSQENGRSGLLTVDEDGAIEAPQTSAEAPSAEKSEIQEPNGSSLLLPLASHANTQHRRYSSTTISRRSSASARRTSIVSSVRGADDQAEEDDDDFGDFEDEEQHASADDGPIAVELPKLTPIPSTTDEAELEAFLEQTVQSFFPSEKPASAIKRSATVNTETDNDYEEEESPFMLTDRAISLWKQLTAAPPLQPPAWKLSRVRRLFLVSLGIPLDLDEILPKMTHKKLILPSQKKKGKQPNARRRKMPPPPDFELHLARQTCQTTEAAINNMDNREKMIHIATLKAHTLAASNLLTYWLEQRELAQTDKETFEAVVENLVKFHKRQMDEQLKRQATQPKKTRFSFRSGGG